MPTTSDYLNQLKVDKNNLINKYNLNGLEVPSTATFTDLVDEFDNLPISHEPNEYLSNIITSNSNINNEFANQILKKSLDPIYINPSVTSTYCLFRTVKINPYPKVIGGENVTNMELMYGHDNSSISTVTTIDVSGLNTNNVTNMARMFSNNQLLTSLNLSLFNTSNVTNMTEMFLNCIGLIYLDIRNFTFNNVTNYNDIFTGIPNNCEIIVKSNTEKQWVLNARNDLINVKTIDELEY